ncbi:sigma-E processing peptidase SpoIIGA [Rossellomorea sp. H39__3]
MTLYLDVIWLLNLLVDCALLWLTGIILKRRYALWRIGSGGLIGSTIILMAFTPLSHLSGSPLVKLSFSVVMVWVAFGFKRMKFFLANLLMFYFVTFLTGGILIGVHYFISFDPGAEASTLIASVRGFGDPISWVFVMLVLPLAWYFSKSRVDHLEYAKIQYDQLVDVSIQFGEYNIRVKGLIDSGNGLQDPIGKKPVMILSLSRLKDEVPDEFIRMAGNVNELLSEDSIDSVWSDRMRLIPAQSIGKTGQLLAALKPDRIMLKDSGAEWEVSNGLIAFREEPLSPDHQFEAIIHPQMAARKPVDHAS